MIVVSDSSPLIAFARIGRLNVLASLYERILVPPEVHHEVTVAGKGLPGADEVCKAGWIEVMPTRPPMNASLEQACQGLGAGERSAILLAKSLRLISFFWTNGRRVASRRRLVLRLRAAWECLRPVLGRVLSPISVKLI